MKIYLYFTVMFSALALWSQDSNEIILKYGADSNRTSGIYLYNARDRKSHKELVRLENNQDYVRVHSNFATARSVNSYMAFEENKISDITLKKYPVAEIRIRVSSIEKPVTFTWSKSYAKGKDWNYQIFYLREPNVWETFTIRMDQPHRRKKTFGKIDSFALQLNYAGHADHITLDIDYIKFRPAADGDIYVDGSKPMVRLKAPFKAKYNNDKLYSDFKFGVWGLGLGGMALGTNNPFYSDSDDALAGRFRANYINSILYPTIIWPAWSKQHVEAFAGIEPRFRKSYAEVIEQIVQSCRKYKMTVAPLTQYVPRVGKFNEQLFREKFMPIIKKYKDAPEIFGWYLADEPGPDFMPTYCAVYQMIQESAPSQVPFVNLCSTYEAYRFSGDIAGMLMTDFYPLNSKNSHLRKELRGKRDPWAVIKWAKQMEEFAEGKPHYLILSTHSFFSQHFPTDPELRLQVYLSLAHGVDSLFFFIPSYSPFWLSKYIDETLIDPYGNPSGVWHTVGELGKRLLPIGAAFAGSKPDQSVKISFKEKNSIVKVFSGQRPGLEYFIRKKGSCCFIFVWNNQLDASVKNRISISDMKPGMKLYDLEKCILSDGSFALKPGDGIIFLLSTENDFRKIAVKAQKIRFENEKLRLLYTLESIQNSLPKAKELIACLDSLKTDSELNTFEKRITKLQADRNYSDLFQKWEAVRADMGKIHRIFSEKIEAPRVIMYQYGKYPVSGTKNPGKQYLKQMYLMSLAFREIERAIRDKGIFSQKNKIELMSAVSQSFLKIASKEFQGNSPSMFSGLHEEELIEIAGRKRWQYYFQRDLKE